jgi:uncharacterized membrane protein
MTFTNTLICRLVVTAQHYEVTGASTDDASNACYCTHVYIAVLTACYHVLLHRILQVELLLSISAFMVALGALWTGVRLTVYSCEQLLIAT